MDRCRYSPQVYATLSSYVENDNGGKAPRTKTFAQKAKTRAEIEVNRVETERVFLKHF
jgi:hypothetical protein